MFEGEEAVLHVIGRIVTLMGLGSTQRHLGWTRDFRTALGCRRNNLLAPLLRTYVALRRRLKSCLCKPGPRHRPTGRAVLDLPGRSTDHLERTV